MANKTKQWNHHGHCILQKINVVRLKVDCVRIGEILVQFCQRCLFVSIFHRVQEIGYSELIIRYVIKLIQKYIGLSMLIDIQQSFMSVYITQIDDIINLLSAERLQVTERDRKNVDDHGCKKLHCRIAIYSGVFFNGLI